MSFIKNIISKNKDILYYILIILLIILFALGYKYFAKSKTNKVIENGYIYISKNVDAFVLKEETVVNVDDEKTIIPIVEQDKRVSKAETIAIYKSEKYDDYIKKLNDLDQQISDAIKLLPEIYSTDINNIDTNIDNLVTSICGKNDSYIKMQEYKNRLDELVYKKNMIITELSPAGSQVKKLVADRNKIEEESKVSADKIKSLIGGIVSYKIDNLESEIKFSKILDLGVQDIENVISKYASNSASKSGLKIVDNYKAYIIVKLKKGEYSDYVVKSAKYNINLVDSNNETLIGTLQKVIESEDSAYLFFNISNGIENLVESRLININLVFKNYYGMIIPNNTIKEDADGSKYLTVIKNGDYVNIKIKIVASSDNMSIVENVDESTEKIALFDKVII